MTEGPMMRQVLLLIALGVSACQREVPDRAPRPGSDALNAVLPTQGAASLKEAVVPKPTDQAQLDRMILAGYTPHGNHLHPPGAKECPLAQGGEVVM
jgi:hypothetical protein